MIVNLIKAKQMFGLTLPNKIKGQYWITDIDEMGRTRNLISVEAIKGEWVVKSNKVVSVLDAQNKPVANTVLKPHNFFNLKIADSTERVLLFTENIDESRQTFRKLVIKNKDTISIGRASSNNICFENVFVSGEHAKLYFDGEGWTLTDSASTNGTYVNGYKVKQTKLNAGDHIYIMGLRIVVGYRFLALNNPDNLVTIKSANLLEYKPQVIDKSVEDYELPEKTYYFRSPRFHREIESTEIKIDPPPQVQKAETVPMALMLGPSLTMGLTSASTAILSVANVLSNGGNISQALPTMIMSFGMLLGTVLWPILTKKHEKKTKLANEKKRQEKYLAYLDQVRDEIKRKCKEQSDILNENMISPEECIEIVSEDSTKLWERTNNHNDFLRVRIGLGTIPLEADVKYSEKKFTMDDDNLQDAMMLLGTEPKQLRNVPISFSFLDTPTVGVYGDKNERFNILKSIVLQLITLYSYDELKIVMITNENEEEEWNFVRELPHLWNDDKSFRFFVNQNDEIKELSAYIEKIVQSRVDDKQETKFSPYYVVLVTNKKLADKSEILKQLKNEQKNYGISMLFAEEELKDLPKETGLIILADESNSKIYRGDDTSGKATVFTADKLQCEDLDSISEKLANIELDLSSQSFILPSMITFLEMFNVSKIEHLNSLTRWKENNPTITLQTPIGIDSTGEEFNLDLHEKYHGPHGLVAGMTGSGKSEFIITYILSLAVNYHPDEVAFILIDYKGGGLTGAFEDSERGVKLPHLAGTITNLDGASVKRSLISIQSELRRRQAIFNEARKISHEGTMDIYKYQKLYRDKIVSEPVPHLFIISDEFAELKSQQPEFMEQLISAARIGRSLGVHLILATQKPSGVVDDQIWSNSKFRICLKVQEKADSQDMIKRPDAAELSQTGRFYLQVGFNELFMLGQSAWCGAEYIPTDTVEKSIDSSIQVVDNLGRVVMSVKPNRKKGIQSSKVKQIVAIVEYLSELAIEEDIHVRPLWLDPIPEKIYVDKLEEKYEITSTPFILNPIVGEYDDPFNQQQNVLTMPLATNGNCLVYGASGNGKTTFLTTLCYSLIKHHSAEEVNIYIMDFGSETLKMFERAPQVGNVMLSSDEEMINNFIKMIYKEMEKRKNLFSEYGGDYASYLKNSGKTLPNIVVLLNNYSGFAEQFEDMQDIFRVLSRDGVKYGIYFVLTAASTNAVRYRIQQNFKTMLTMQLNDASEYTIVVGRTEGLVPSKFKGRGLVALDKVYEFQTAYCSDADDIQESMRKYCNEIREKTDVFAKSVPVLPSSVDFEFIRPYIDNLSNIPVGVNKKTLNIEKINISNKVIYPVVSQDIGDSVLFAAELAKVTSLIAKTAVVDVEKQMSDLADISYEYITDNVENFVKVLFADMVERNNIYKDSNMDIKVLDKYEEKVYFFIGIKKVFERLSDDGKDKLSVLIEKAESIYKIHFVLVDSLTQINTCIYDAWYTRHASSTEGIWVADGITDQYILKLAKLTKELYEDIDNDYGYVIARSKHAFVKLLNASKQGEE